MHLVTTVSQQTVSSKKTHNPEKATFHCVCSNTWRSLADHGSWTYELLASAPHHVWLAAGGRRSSCVLVASRMANVAATSKCHVVPKLRVQQQMVSLDHPENHKMSPSIASLTSKWPCLTCLIAKPTARNRAIMGPKMAQHLSLLACVCGADFFFARGTFALFRCE